MQQIPKWSMKVAPSHRWSRPTCSLLRVCKDARCLDVLRGGISTLYSPAALRARDRSSPNLRSVHVRFASTSARSVPSSKSSPSSKLAGLKLGSIPVSAPKKTIPSRLEARIRTPSIHGPGDPDLARLRQKLEDDRRRQEEQARLAEQRKIDLSIEAYHFANTWFSRCRAGTEQIRIEASAVMLQALESPAYFVLRRSWLQQLLEVTKSEDLIQSQVNSIKADLEPVKQDLAEYRQSQLELQARLRQEQLELEELRRQALQQFELDEYWIMIRPDRYDESELSEFEVSGLDRLQEREADLDNDIETEETSGNAAFDSFKQMLVRFVRCPKDILHYVTSSVRQMFASSSDKLDLSKVRELRLQMDTIHQQRQFLEVSAHKLRDAVRQRRVPSKVVDTKNPLQVCRDITSALRVKNAEFAHAITDFKGIINSLAPDDRSGSDGNHGEVYSKLEAFKPRVHSSSITRNDFLCGVLSTNGDRSLLQRIELSRALHLPLSEANLIYWAHIRTQVIDGLTMIIRDTGRLVGDVHDARLQTHLSKIKSDATGLQQDFFYASEELRLMLEHSKDTAGKVPDVTNRLQRCLDQLRVIALESDRRWFGSDVPE